MQQHAESVGGAQAAAFRGRKERSDNRHIDQIGDNGVSGQAPNVEIERGLSPMPSVVVLTRSAASRAASFDSSQPAGCTRSPKV